MSVTRAGTPLQRMPVVGLARVWHVGEMRADLKRPNSYEGAGLSVSTCPEAWRSIAGSAGPTWRLERAGAQFLDALALDEAQWAKILAWGCDQDYVQPRALFRVRWFDDEDGDWRFWDLVDGAGAAEEAESVGGEVLEVSGHVATERLRKRTHSNAEPVEVPDLLATVLAEQALGLDGVWWHERLDVCALSAPRGVIVPARLGQWHAVRERAPEPGCEAPEP